MLSRVLVSEVHISPAFDPSNPPNNSDLKKYFAIWDTGATSSVITQKVVSECGLKPTGVAQVHTVGGTTLTSKYLVGIWLPNNVRVPQVNVTEGMIAGDAEILIGMDIINNGDFAVTNKDGKTNFSFRIPSIECIDFVRQQPSTVQSGGETLRKVGRNDLCPCGSGKKYKRCCGKQ